MHFECDGDAAESQYWPVLRDRFPHIEAVWRYLVVPTTHRLDTDRQDPAWIRHRESVDPELRELGAVNHSILVNLIDAMRHSNGYQTECLVEDTYFHLGTTCDLVEDFLERFYLLTLRWSGAPPRTFTSLTKEEFLAISAQWYDESYPSLWDHYLSKGKKGPPISIPGGANLLKEAALALNVEQSRREYAALSQQIRAYRNVTTHNPRIMRALGPDGRPWIPRLDRLAKYRNWHQFETAARTTPEALQQDLQELGSQLGETLERLLPVLNSMWDAVARRYAELLFAQRNPELLKALDLELLE
jgi:hypothetical protein